MSSGKPVVKLFKQIQCGLCPAARKMLEHIRPQIETTHEIKVYDIAMKEGRAEAAKVGLLMVPAFAVDDKIVSSGIPGSAEKLIKLIKDA